MNKTLTTILLITALPLTLLSACGGKGAKEEVNAVSEPGVLKVAVVDGNDRFARNVSGVPEGIEADIAKIVAEKGDYAIRFTVVKNEDVMINGVTNGEFDLGFGRIADSDERIAGLTASAVYGKGGLFLATPKYNYMDCLTIMQAGTLGISARAEAIKDEVEGIGEISTESYADLQELGSAIASGTVLAGLVSEREALSMINDNVQAQELINSPKEQYVAVMPKGSPLAGTVNDAISQYKLNGPSGEEEQ